MVGRFGQVGDNTGMAQASRQQTEQTSLGGQGEGKKHEHSS